MMETAVGAETSPASWSDQWADLASNNKEGSKTVSGSKSAQQPRHYNSTSSSFILGWENGPSKSPQGDFLRSLNYIPPVNTDNAAAWDWDTDLTPRATNRFRFDDEAFRFPSVPKTNNLASAEQEHLSGRISTLSTETKERMEGPFSPFSCGASSDYGALAGNPVGISLKEGVVNWTFLTSSSARSGKDDNDGKFISMTYSESTSAGANLWDAIAKGINEFLGPELLDADLYSCDEDFKTHSQPSNVTKSSIRSAVSAKVDEANSRWKMARVTDLTPIREEPLSDSEGDAVSGSRRNEEIQEVGNSSEDREREGRACVLQCPSKTGSAFEPFPPRDKQDGVDETAALYQKNYSGSNSEYGRLHETAAEPYPKKDSCSNSEDGRFQLTLIAQHELSISQASGTIAEPVGPSETMAERPLRSSNSPNRMAELPQTEKSTGENAPCKLNVNDVKSPPDSTWGNTGFREIFESKSRKGDQSHKDDVENMYIHRSCLQIPKLRSWKRPRKLPTPDYTSLPPIQQDFSEFVAASQELTEKDDKELFPKTRVVGFARRYDNNHNAFTNLNRQTARTQSYSSCVQSLFEYEFDSGPHMSVVFNEFGNNPLQQVIPIIHKSPPEKTKEGLNKVVLKVEASTVSPTDCAIRSGLWAEEFQAKTPMTPGVDVVGKICRIDRESSKLYKLKVGDRVMSLVKWGGNARYLTVDPSKLVKISDDVDPAEAVCLVETYLLAFQLIHAGHDKSTRYRSNCLQDKTVFVLGEMTSNLGRAIAQLCTLAGCRRVISPSTLENFKAVSAMGVIPIVKEENMWLPYLSGSVDLLIHLAGRLSPTKASKMLGPSGRVVIATTYSKADSFSLGQTYTPLRACSLGRAVSSFQDRVTRYNIFRAWEEDREWIREDLQHLAFLHNKAAIVPNVLDRVPLTKVGKAHQLLETKRHSGFIVCEPWLVSKSRCIRL